MEFLREKKLPKATAKRLPAYLRHLKLLDATGVQRIKSKEFAEITQVPSATIRRDFSHLGELGRSGYGYDVPYLIEVLSHILETNEEKKIALIGFGNLGKALANNNFRRNENLSVSAVFDNDPSIVGQMIGDQYVYGMDQLAAIVQEKGITVAISTVPSRYSQHAIDAIVNAGITAILNFAPDPVVVPKAVNIQYIDLTTELQTLIFFDTTYSQKTKV